MPSFIEYLKMNKDSRPDNWWNKLVYYMAKCANKRMELAKQTKEKALAETKEKVY